MRETRFPEEMRGLTSEWRRSGLSIGFVPTMGFLHEGHLSLVRASRARCDRTVVSIFVNPTQFGPKEDLDRYPRDMDRDWRMLEQEHCDALFVPEVAQMYPPGWKTFVDVADLQDGLCGRSRPGHFRGVTTIVAKFFNTVSPDVAFFGQKDAQQAVIIRRMTRDLLLPIEIVVEPTVRESDGLAMSSRNSYLSVAEREQAPAIYRGLVAARSLCESGERRADRLVARVREEIAAAGIARIEYVEAVDAESLQPVTEVARPTLLAAAVRVGATRLIDNITLLVDDRS